MVLRPPHCAQRLSLRALLYTVFDKEKGTTICCSDPPTAVGDKFKPLGRYLLPETNVKGRVVSVVLDDNVILGAPVYIEDTIYSRNCFQFNICAVISSRIDVEPYRDLAQHLASAFHALEIETWLLSEATALGPCRQRDQVQALLGSLRRQLAECGECFVRVDDSRCISFRVGPCSPVLAAAPGLSEIPVPLVDLTPLCKGLPAGFDDEEEGLCRVPSGLRAMLYDPDMSLQSVAGFVDGCNRLCDIIEKSKLGDEDVIVCVRHLIHFGLVAVIEDITWGSRYWLTPEFHTAFDRPDIRDEVVRYVTVGKHEGDEELRQIFQGLYCCIGLGKTLKTFHEEHEAEFELYSISIRHFITFGMLCGFLQRVDSFIQVLSPEEACELKALQNVHIKALKQELLDTGMQITDVNKDKQVRELVKRMNDLRAKEKSFPVF